MDPQFQELAATIARDVTEIVKRDVTDVLRRDVTEIVKRDVTEALKEHVTEVVSAAEQRLAKRARVHARRLARQARVNVEAVKSEARLAAEGYAATVDAIHRRLDRIEARLDTKFGDYDAVLKNHNDRITTLEQKNP